MTYRMVRVLIGAIGVFALARGLGQLSDPLQLIALLFLRQVPRGIVLDWVTGLGLVAVSALVCLGVVLLVRPPVWLLGRLKRAPTFMQQLRGIVGVFLVAVAIEQVCRFSLILERTIEQTLYHAPAVGLVLLALMAIAVPLGLAALGVRLIVKTQCGIDAPAPSQVEPSEVQQELLPALWSVVAVLMGAILLALAMPELPGIAWSIGMNYSPGAEGDRTWISLYTWTRLVPFTAQVGIAIYLLAGAPHLARWHLAKLGNQTDPEPKTSS